MAGEKIIGKPEAVAPGLKSDSSTKKAEKDLASKKDRKVSVTGIKGEIDQPPVAGAYYPPTSYYDYYYPGYNGTFNQLDDRAYFNAGIPSDNSSLLYYLPGYATGFVGGDGKQPYVSSGYLQQPVSYGSETMPWYSWGSKYCADITKSTAPKSRNARPTFGRNGPVKSTNDRKTDNYFSSKANLFHLVGDFSSYTSQNQGFYFPYDPINYQRSGGMWNADYRYSKSRTRNGVSEASNYKYSKSRGNFTRNGVSEASAELPRGPRADRKSNNPSKSTAEEEQREKYNKEDFKSQYDNAKFYVIKSYSEDDIHKCVKYDVWSSTTNGNKKLDNAFREAEANSSGADSSCPVFLFFSVNGSGQFLGVAEMVGRVDFSRNMDFWLLDKWSGFLPVKWHIVKDVPNTQFRHIILENNDNRPVTYSRDTQEIGLKEGLEMLNIFKSYPEKTSILDDFNFYEKREKFLKAKRHSKPASQADSLKQFKGRDKTNSSYPTASVTKKLSIKSNPSKSSV